MKLYLRTLHGPTDWGWVKEQTNVLRVEDTTGIVGIDLEKNETVAACVMDSWTDNSCLAHLMITTPMVFRHDFLQECADYFFNVAKLKYVFGLVPGDNHKALKLNKRLGFKEKSRLKDAWADGVDYVLLELTKETCTMLPKTDSDIEIIKEASYGR